MTAPDKPCVLDTWNAFMVFLITKHTLIRHAAIENSLLWVVLVAFSVHNLSYSKAKGNENNIVHVFTHNILVAIKGTEIHLRF